MRTTFRRLFSLATCLIVLGVLAAPAAAQQTSVTADQYGDTSHQFGGGGTDPSSTVGSLPFTGLDLGLMAAAAAGLVAGGVLLRRRSAADQGRG